MKKEGGCEWYQSMGLIFLYISANFLLFFKGPRPQLNNSVCSQIESRHFRCKKHYSGWDSVQIISIPGSSHPLSSSIPGGLLQNRNYEKKPCRGRQIAGGSLPKSSLQRWDLVTIEDDTGWVQPLQLLEKKTFWVDFTSPHRYRRDSGWEPLKFSSGYMYQKIRNQKSVQCSEDFFTTVVDHEILSPLPPSKLTPDTWYWYLPHEGV